MSAEIRDIPLPQKSAYQTALSVASWFALVAAGMAGLALLWEPRWNSLLALQRIDEYKQLTGYVLVGLLSFSLSLSLIKRRLHRVWSLRSLQLAHRILGVTMLILLILHAGFAHAGFLRATFTFTLLVVATGALLNLLPSRKLAQWGQWTTAIHIGVGCLLAALALMHLYFAYSYAA